jgi:hypothetical protein
MPGGGDNGAGDDLSIGIDIGGARISVSPGFDPDHLARVIAAVRAAL